MKVWSRTDPGTVLNTCVNKRYNKLLCDNPKFWKAKFTYDFPDANLEDLGY